jgi:uncharacterized membrane protein YccC
MPMKKLHRFLIHQRPRLFLAARGALASLIALAAAEFLHLECPYWAAMTALIVIQPTRGLLFEKSFYRLVGSAIGSAAGLLFVLHAGSPAILVILISLWMAACVGAGNLLYGLRSYACMMAACTCAVIAMNGTLNPSHLYGLAIGRVACIMIGIIASTAVTAIFTPASAEGDWEKRLRQLCGDLASWLALNLREGSGQYLLGLEREVIVEIAEMESSLDAASAGSPALKKQKRHIEGVITALLSLLAVGRLSEAAVASLRDESVSDVKWLERIEVRLESLAERSEGESFGAEAPAEMADIAAEIKLQLPLLSEVLAETAAALDVALNGVTVAVDAVPQGRLVRHRDWREAGRAAMRAGLAMSAAGGIWALTGWKEGPMLLMALSIMISIFSSKDNPVAFVGEIMLGASTGAAVALFCRIMLLNGVDDPFVVAAAIAPFLFVGVFAMAQRRTAIPATDATLFFLFVTHPGVTLDLSAGEQILAAIAMVLGVGTAWSAYRYLVPVTPAIRLNSLRHAISRDLKRLASAQQSPARGDIRPRLQHRVLRLVTLAKVQLGGPDSTVDSAIAALAVARCLEQLRKLQDHALLDARAVETVQSVLDDLSRAQDEAPRLLETAAKRLYGMLKQGDAAPTTVQPMRDAATLCRESATWWDRWSQSHG